MKFKELELQRKKDDLETLVRNYTTVSEQLRLEGDGPRQNQLKDQLQSIGQKMEFLEKEIKALELELQQEQMQVRDLINLLQNHESQFQDILKIYQQVLTNWRCQVNPSPPSCKDVVQELLRIPQGRSPHTALNQFVGCLVRSIDNAALVTALQTWGQQCSLPWEDLLEWLDSLQAQQQQTAQPALLIVINRSDEASTQSQGGDRYQLKAWLIQDIAHYKQHRQGYTALEGAAATDDATYSVEELQEQAPQFILQFLAECANAYDNDPEIHIFLPLVLIEALQAVDCWLLQDDFGRPERLGHRYRVVLRCNDRLGRSYRHRPKWVKKWRKQQALLQETALNVFIPCDDSDLDDLFDRLEELEDEAEDETADIARIGLKMTQAPCQFGAGSAFGAVLQFGFPLAIWSRCNLAALANAAEIDRLLQAAALERLPDCVKQERRKCRKKPEDSHIGHHLALIWDDPDLVPPKSA